MKIPRPIKGSIRQVELGKYEIILNVTHAVSGKHIIKRHYFAGTKEEAHSELARLRCYFPRSGPSTEECTTVEQALEKWLSHVKPSVSLRTYERYAELARRTLLPLIGNTLLLKFSPSLARQALERAASCGRRDGLGGLSNATILRAYRVLDRAMKHAVRGNALCDNPLDAIAAPQIVRPPLEMHGVDCNVALIEALRNSRVYIPMLLALMAGLRRGEICALRWHSVDLESAKLTIHDSVEQLNSSCSVRPLRDSRQRIISISAFVVHALRAHLKHQVELGRVSHHKSSDGDQFVCTVRGGGMLRPTRLTHEWTETIRQSGLPPRRFHDLRHEHAMSLLSEGMSLEGVNERLGNSNVSVTAQLYAHALPDLTKATETQLDSALANSS